MRSFAALGFAVAAFFCAALVGTGECFSQETAEEQSMILLQNVRVFDGKSDALRPDLDVLVKGNHIEKIGKKLSAPDGARVLDGGGRTLTPGFIDAHTHLQWNLGVFEQFAAPIDYQAALSLLEAKNTLMRGFTTIRDVAGSVFGVKRSIDEGIFPGPRIYSGGAALTMTAGHGDMRTVNSLPRLFGGVESEVERIGMCIFADGVPEVLTACRVQFRNGADFIKVFAGGAVSGMYDPVDIGEYSKEELEAAVGEAKRWNTYVAVHAYTDKSVRDALEAGAMTIEHANLVSEDTIKLAVKKGAYISAQTGVFLSPPPESFTPAQKARQKLVADGLDHMMKMAKKHKAKIGFGSDMIGSIELKKMQSTEFTNRTKWFSNAEILRQATSVNGEILALSGPRNPYPGKLGVIEEGALADLLLIQGNPLEDIKLLLNPEENIDLIMKDGTIYKNTLSEN
ncbi:metal-dependent hydrolase family protein [Desulfobaculum bizertense]|uniref:Imidazolonepropionase n=1 Tax=Desulfobaculum bizertense DSM 18034 TaxID=1121442 RepID=A0A1T4WK55_9BACT|nr:amidohydrolase family protein [Desulfobaculum bizertense]SKA77713.1 Imidazolonepropionase [Desulfobaculum bizertense DSM 18034]